MQIRSLLKSPSWDPRIQNPWKDSESGKTKAKPVIKSIKDTQGADQRQREICDPGCRVGSNNSVV